MTDDEYIALRNEHLMRDYELATDQVLARAVLCRHARRRGSWFFYVNAGA